MAQTQAEYMRAYRRRKREGLTQHPCPACGREHYPVSPSRVAEPKSEGLTSEGLTSEGLTSEGLTSEGLTPTGQPAPCGRCATARARLQTAVTQGKACTDRAIAAEAEAALLRARLAYIERSAPTPYARCSREPDWP
jgi:hypothetical protein